jgi:hypothetical protein
VASSSLAAKICLPRCYPSTPGTNRDGDGTNRGGGIVGGEDSALAVWSISGHCTMASSIQMNWQSDLRLDFLQILLGNSSEALQQNCSPIYHLHLCYSIPRQILTGLWSKWLTNLVLGHCQSEIQTSTTWQPDFECDYLQILHNDLAYTLKKICSPLLGLQIWCGDLGKNLRIWRLQNSKVEPISLISDLVIWEKVWLFAYKPKT